MSAFTIAFLVPNLVRSLFADAAIQAAFVPVFTEQLEHGRRREAFRLASTLIFLVALVLGLITALFILLAPVLMPLFAPGFDGRAARPHGRRSRSSCSRSWSCSGSPGSSSASSTATTASASSRSRRSSGTSRSSPCSSGSRPRSPRATRSTPTRSASSSAPSSSSRSRLRPAQHAVLGVRCRVVRLARSRRRRAPGAAADAPGDDQPRADQLQPARSTASSARLVSDAGARPRSTRRSGSTCCPRGSSRSRSRRCSSRPWRASPPAASSTTCGRRWRTGCARSCCC